MIAVGVGSAASYHLNPTNMQGLSSVFQIGIAYAVGVLLAFIVSHTLPFHTFSMGMYLVAPAGDCAVLGRTLQSWG